MDRIRQTLVPLYQQTATQDHTQYAWTESSEAQTLAYVERVARSELGMIMPGEVSYVNSNRSE